MKRSLTGLRALLPVALFLSALPAHAQSSAAVPGSAGPLYYDVTKETTLTGAVSSVVTKPAPGMIMGAHLLIATPSGTVDASLGHFALIGKDALAVSPGEQVTVTGVMRTLGDKQVFLARTVKTSTRLFLVRNERGAMLSPHSPERLSQSSAQQGVQP